MKKIESSERCEMANCHRRAQFEIEKGDTEMSVHDISEVCGPCAKYYWPTAHAKMEAERGPK